MLIGFGFLMIFLRFHRWNSLGLTLYVSAFGIQFYFFSSGIIKKFFLSSVAIPAIMTINSFQDMIKAEFGAIWVLISLGALMGKVDYF